MFGRKVNFMRAAVLFLASAAVQVAGAAEIVFSRDVLPVLSDNCFHCHGPDAKEGRKGDLRLDEEADAKRDRSGFRVVKEGDAEASELIRRIVTSDADERMPPVESGKSLSEEQLATLRTWVEQGAKWGRHWAFERVERPDTGDDGRHPVDVLVARRLKEEDVGPNARASRRTLIRRLKLDLTGLPPTPEQVEKFLADKEPGAWERLVDRTLASPAYGERMAWDWLEAARYADSNGYQGDRERTMWPWRDWVVRAFNDNLSFDQFTIWQLAGDLLPGATHDQILATGFCRNHMINGEGGRIAEENRVDYVFDMTETMGTVWLGLTLNCSRCHDHKFDPVTQREYYQLTAFFNQTPVTGKGGNAQTPPVLDVPSKKQREESESARAEARRVSAAIAKRTKQLDTAQREWEKARLAEAERVRADAWRRVIPTSAEAKKQTLEIQSDGGVLATGAYPANDEYEVVYSLEEGELGAFRLDAVTHPSMPKGRLSRNDSGNFVLSDIAFELLSPDAKPRRLEVGRAKATFEQNGLKIAKAIDDDPVSGWGVWDGRSVDRDHAAVFRLKERVKVAAGASLRVSLKFNSRAKYHIMGHFRLSQSSADDPGLVVADASLLGVLKIPAGKRNDKQRKQVREAYHNADGELGKLRKRKASADARAKKIQGGIPKVMVMRDMEKARVTYMLDRGLYNQRGEEVTAGVPASLPTMPASGRTNRLALARWLVARDHPLTARVTVNRFWQGLFGVGLVKTSEDFGVQGEYPVQRELLDWLAAEFMESGWDVKGLLRTIVTSETYRRSAAIASAPDYERDPDNRLLARGPRFRMPSWMIRDQALAASGLLNREKGGASVYSYQPAGIWSEATFGKKKFSQDTGDKLYRRSLYTFWRRIVGPAMFFDSAKRQVCEVKPLRTNTPMHALTTLNDVTYVEAARALAERILNQAEDDESRLALAARRVLSRKLTPEETVVWLRSLDRATKRFTTDGEAAKRFVAHGDTKPESSLAPATLAAWTAVCLNLLNLDETLNKE